MGKYKSSSYGDDIPKWKKYLLSMLHVSDNGQAKPAVYEIQKEDSRYFIVSAFKRLYIGYDRVQNRVLFSEKRYNLLNITSNIKIR